MSSPMFFNQAMVILDTTTSINPTTASLVLYGGVSLGDLTQSTNTSTGALVINGGLAVQSNLYGTYANLPNLESVNLTTKNLDRKSVV